MQAAYPFLFIAEFIIFALLFVFLQLTPLKIWISKGNNFRTLLLGILGLHIVSAGLLTQEVTDVMLSGAAGWHIRHGLDFYAIDAGHGQYPYFPFLLGIHALLNWITEEFHFFTFSFYLKVFLLLPALYMISLVVYKQSITITQARQQVLLLLVNPITYGVVIFHGQSDVVVVCLFLMSIHFLQVKTKSGQKMFMSALLYAASIGAKTWSFVFFPIMTRFFKKKREIVMYVVIVSMMLTANVFIYTRLISGARLSDVFGAVLAAGGPMGVWGISLFAKVYPPLLAYIQIYRTPLFAILWLGVAVVVLKRRLGFWVSCLHLVIGLYLILLTWGVQYLFWTIPFIFLNWELLDKKHLFLFWVLSSTYLFGNYLNIAFAQNVIYTEVIHLLGVILWLFFGWWFVSLQKSKFLHTS